MNVRRAISKGATAGIIIAIIVAAVAGFFGGRASVPVKTVTKSAVSTSVKTVTKTVTSTVTSAVTKTTTVTSAVTTTKTKPVTTTKVTTTTATTTTTKTTTTTTTTTTTKPVTTTTSTTTTTTSVKPVAPGALHKTIIYLIEASGSTRVLTIKRGVADTGAVLPDQISALVGTKKGSYEIIKKNLGLSFDITYIVLNCLKPPFNNVLVRRALAYAVPYEMIWKTVYAGLATRLVGVIPKGMLGWTDYKVIDYKLNLALAKKLIQEAGINPSQYVISIYYNRGNSARAKIATLLSQYWGMLGFKVMVQALSWPQLLERTEKPQFDVYIIGWAPDYDDPDDYVGPQLYGGTKFDFVHVYQVSSAADVAKYLSSAKVFDTPNYYVIVGPAGTGAKVSVSGKPIIVVQYKLAKKQIPPQNCTSFSTINPAFYRNTSIDALVIAGRNTVNPSIRKPIYQAIERASNIEVPIIWLAQNIAYQVYWNWVKGMYYNPILAQRWDLVWEEKPPATPSVGIGNYVNNRTTFVIATFGWPQSLDPAKDYETFGWEIFHEVGDTLVTYWKSDTSHVVPDGAVAWAHNANGTTWFFVIRGGMKAYDPWHHKVYPVNATDFLFTIWRIARLNLDPSWMINAFINVNASYVMTESEFNKYLSTHPMYATYNGKTIKVSSLKQLLQFFGYSGPTAGVLVLKLYKPYAAILNILADPFTMVIPAKYLFDYVPSLKGKYLQAMKAAEWGKNPSAWAKYIGTGEKEPTHLFLNKYLIGTGPYYIAAYKLDSYIILKINPYYWDWSLWHQLYGYTPKG